MTSNNSSISHGGVANISVQQDPILSAVGLGKRLWEAESGDAFVERLRAEDTAVPQPIEPRPQCDATNRVEAAWQRIVRHQGEEFHTATGLPFRYEVDGNGLWVFRGGRRINRRLPRKDVETAIGRCPLRSTTEVNDLQGLSYLFGILMDRRIRESEW